MTKLTKKDIEIWLLAYNVDAWSINEDLSVNVSGNVDISKEHLTEIPVQFNEVSGIFNCDYNKLTSFKGMPKKIGSSLYASNNLINSFEGFPEYVGTSVRLLNNKITHLTYIKTTIEKNIYFDYNSIKTVNNFNCCFNNLFLHEVEREEDMIIEFQSYYEEINQELYQLKLKPDDFKTILFNYKLENSLNNKNKVNKKKI